MSDDENCALRPDGTLKEANEITFFNSPSDKHPIGNNAKTDSESGSSSDDDLPDLASLGHGLKGKEPARRVAGKRVIVPSAKVRNAQPSVQSFFHKAFTVGRASTSKASSSTSGTNTVKDAAEEPRKRQHEPGPDAPKKRAKNVKANVIESDEEDAGGDNDHEDEDDEDPMEKYERMRKEGDHDRQPKRKHNPRGKDARTQDIRL
ncbi:hypothetical protein LshimejAT787_1101570 [Lyophyllum shimeji]|uniref:Uncharacterized protein n=1 Tax=Lyophyllum shimeji TaxID=47721 RepID=A0A9P3PST8_LYOSH|nr:hypothetical protein LshimejAT787_1101570 [Lyophyllum shimeji]